jgi:hypothetical protein
MRQLVFHSALFTAQPAVIKPDDASRRLDNPRQFCDRDSRSRDLIRGRDEPLAQGGARPVVKRGAPAHRDLLRSMRSNGVAKCQDRSNRPRAVGLDLVHCESAGCGALPADLAARNRRSGEARPDMPARNHLKLNSFLALVDQEPGHTVRRLLSTPTRPPVRPPHGWPREPLTIAQSGAGDQPV